MPWQKLTRWIAGRKEPVPDSSMPLTLVTLTAMEHAEQDEVAFYSDAEYEALLEWAKMGRFILALSAVERSELTLVCVESAEEMREQVQDLPLVAAGLATYDIRVVTPLRLTNPRPVKLN